MCGYAWGSVICRAWQKVMKENQLEVGVKLGRLLLLSSAKIDGRVRWLCRCDCGREKRIRDDALRSGATSSCGCLSVEKSTERVSRHGLHKAPGYSSWNAMISRCTRPENDNFKHYGGRGISVCERWKSVELFLEDMGRPSPGQQIDRIDVNGNYEPGNCRWVSAKENANNRRNNVLISAFGAEMPAIEWSEKLGVPRPTIATRLRRGWPPEKAVSFIKPKSGTKAK